MRDWPVRLLGALEPGGPVALVSILATDGSVPREAGTHMIVTADRVLGTIGGGNLEYQAIAQARAALDLPPGDWRVQDYPLGPLLGQCCGGRVRLLVEHIDATRGDWIAALAARAGPVSLTSRFEMGHVARVVAMGLGSVPAMTTRGLKPEAGAVMVEYIGADETPLLLFGGGHVGTAVADMFGRLPFALRWMDVRAELGPGVMVLADAELIARATTAGPDAMLLIMTHDHALDYRLLRGALQGRAGFVGVIGSATKRARFLSKLRRDGFGEGDCARFICPIGDAAIHGKEPEVIAVAIAAQLLALRSPVAQPVAIRA